MRIYRHEEASVTAPNRSYVFSQDWFSANVPAFQRFLGHLENRPCRLLDIGTYEGQSAIWLNDNIGTHPWSRIDTIDWVEHASFRRNMVQSGSSKIIFHLGPSVVVMRTLPLGVYDFAFIDGHHSGVYVLEDAVHAFPLVKIGGIVCFDDYLWDNPRHCRGTPKAAIDAFLSIYADEIELLSRGYQIWIRKRLRVV